MCEMGLSLQGQNSSLSNYNLKALLKKIGKIADKPHNSKKFFIIWKQNELTKSILK